MKRAVITGATGAIGTALIDEFIKQNIEVLVIVRKDSSRLNVIPKDNPLVTVMYGDLADYANMNNTTGKEWDVFYHLAWAGASGNGRNDMYLQNSNVKYALDAVGLAKRLGCKTFIGAGSQAEYGLHNEKLRPNTDTKPYMGYGYAKLCAGYMTREYAHQKNMKHIWVRILSVYGPNDGENSMISRIIKDLKAGNTPKMTAGKQEWDYLYSSDAAKALYLLGEKGADNKTYVLGSGETKTIREYVEIIRDKVAPGQDIDFGAVPYGVNQIMYLCADASELCNDTGWKPETSFEEGIVRIIDSIKG